MKKFFSIILKQLKNSVMINWEIVKEYEDITFKKHNGVARIAFNRPEVRNALDQKQ